tara:strand:+ start:570 stop:797 length:228 start_codon:yes stop_codon:yes gene_type:complete
MEIPKKYVGKIEKTLYVIEEIEIIAGNEAEAEDLMLEGYGKVVGTDIQEEKTKNYWIDSSEPLATDEFMDYKDNL